jgi:antitoxin CptB|tara:strand:- start:75 stop:332 length:258 start_codon:yes stop_codon:yes gene_type:complete
MMIDKEILKKQIIYRSTHRGTKEMDILLGNFVKEYIDRFNNDDLLNLEQLLFVDDEILYRWYYDKENSEIIPNNKVSKMLKNFKL